MRRWRRNLSLYCPRIPTYRLAWQTDLANADPAALTLGWEYALLSLWVTQQKITGEQAAAMVRAVIDTVLFDVMQAADGTDQIHQQDYSVGSGLKAIDVDTVAFNAQLRWQTWQTAKLGSYSPNCAPVIKQPTQLKAQSSAQFYQTLVNLLNGEHTLYDLAIEMRREIIEVAASLHPCIQLGWIELRHIPDLPAPVYRHRLPAAPAIAPVSGGMLIACVDDSLLVRHTMEKLLTSAGYQFLGVDDPVRAIGILLARKPSLIFLDLVMPKTSGHEVCQQLRKLSCFRTTPIVMLTGSDGFANRLKSNFVGASDFLSKPLDAEAVLSVIRKHLHQGATHLPVAADHS